MKTKLAPILQMVLKVHGCYLPVLGGHALNTSTDTNLDHARLDGIGNVDDGLETRRALTVQCLDGSGLGEASNEGSSTELSSTTTGRQDGADGNILNILGIDTALLDNSLEDTSQEVSGSSVFETTLATLGQGSAKGTGHDDIIGVLLGEGGGSLLTARAEVGGNLGKTLLSCKGQLVGPFEFQGVLQNCKLNVACAESRNAD